MDMDKKQLLVLFRSTTRSQGTSVLEVEYVITSEGVYSGCELKDLFKEHFPSKNSMILESFEEFKSYIEFLCVRFRKNAYKFLSVNQYNQDQSEFDGFEQFAQYFKNVKSFALNTKAQDKKGLLGRFLSR